MSGGSAGRVEQERSRLDLARRQSEEAAMAYRRARLAALRGGPSGLRASRAELVRRREALAAELERVGRLACPTAEAAAPLALAFRDAWKTLERTDPLPRGGKTRRRP